MSVARGKRPQTEGADHIMPRRKDNSTALPGNIASSASKRPRRNATADITVGCLFAAIGGFAKAFEQNGASVLWANEKDRFASETFRANFPAVRQIHKPIEELTVAGDSLEPVDVLTGGFPCQPFSIAGEAKGFKDDRGLLFLHIIRLIREFGHRKPKILLLENVQNFKTHDKGRTFRRVQSEIQKAGYWFSEKNSAILNTATHTHIPQNRARIFMVALSTDHFSTNAFEFPEITPLSERYSVWDFIDLHEQKDQRYYFTPDSQYYDQFAAAIRESGDKSIYLLRRSYIRENKSGTCFTLMANMGEGGHNQPVIKDKWGIRKLTPRECARLQGYEDAWFAIPRDLSHTQIYKQIGNSVTVPLIKKLAEECIRQLKVSAVT